jgi:hypothetical protein
VAEANRSITRGNGAGPGESGVRRANTRSQTQFILDRVESIAEKGYFREQPSRDPIGRSPEAVA